FARHQGLQAENMCIREIGNVDVVAETGSVRSRIVGAENLYVSTTARRRIENQRNQMRFRIGILAKLRIGIRSGGVEVAQREILQSMTLAEPAERALERQLGFAVRIDRQLRSVFNNGHDRRNSIGRAS